MGDKASSQRGVRPAVVWAAKGSVVFAMSAEARRTRRLGQSTEVLYSVQQPERARARYQHKDTHHPGNTGAVILFAKMLLGIGSRDPLLFPFLRLHPRPFTHGQMLCFARRDIQPTAKAHGATTPLKRHRLRPCHDMLHAFLAVWTADGLSPKWNHGDAELGWKHDMASPLAKTLVLCCSPSFARPSAVPTRRTGRPELLTRWEGLGGPDIAWLGSQAAATPWYYVSLGTLSACILPCLFLARPPLTTQRAPLAHAR